MSTAVAISQLEADGRLDDVLDGDVDTVVVEWFLAMREPDTVFLGLSADQLGFLDQIAQRGRDLQTFTTQAAEVISGCSASII